MSYRVLSHTADTGIEATASSLRELIEVLAGGMFSLMAPGNEPGGGEQPAAGRHPRRQVTVEVAAGSITELVVDILAELLFHSEVENLVFTSFEVEMAPGDLRAVVTAGGVPVPEVEVVGPPIKAVTYHDLIIERRDGEWYGRVYFDV
jgi:SHS2 domain-containing protein